MNTFFLLDLNKKSILFFFSLVFFKAPEELGGASERLARPAVPVSRPWALKWRVPVVSVVGPFFWGKGSPKKEHNGDCRYVAMLSSSGIEFLFGLWGSGVFYHQVLKHCSEMVFLTGHGRSQSMTCARLALPALKPKPFTVCLVGPVWKKRV